MASKRKVNEDHGADPKTQGNPLLAESQHAGRVSRFFSPLDEAFYKTSQDVEPYWASLVKYRDTMLLGQVLFPTLSASTAAASLSGKRAGRVKENMFKQKCAGIQREFVPLFPGMLRSLQALGTCKAGEYLLIRMIPSNDNELPVPIEVLPDLEIAIFGDENTIFVKHVRLVTSSQLDFLLPENFMDLRFIRERSIYRSGSMRLDPSLDLFLENSNLNIFSAEPLKTPSVLRLSIPTHSISSRKSLADLPNSLSVQFTSAGIEHRSELRIPYLRESSDSWAQLRYTSIEAGRFGGRRDELCLKDKERLPFYPTWSRSDHEYRRVRSKSERINDDERIATLFNKANVLVKDLVTAQNTHPLSKLQQELVIKKAPTGFLRKIHWEPVERDMVGTGFSSKIRPVSVGRMIHPIRLA